MGPQITVIKKYGNRRLYDSTHSRYINMDEVAQLVRDGGEVQVVDAVTGEDLTRSVLTQIVVEQARGNDSAFPLDVLRQMIAASGRVTNDATLKYVKAVFDIYQSAYRAVSPDVVVPPPPFAAPSPAGPPAAAPQHGPDVDALQKRIEELEAAVSGIRSKPAPRKKRRPTKRR